MRRGILSHHLAGRLDHETVAMPEIQALREEVVVPGGRRLHEYVNLYFSARNPMLYKRQAQHASLCVLRVTPDVLDIPGTVVTDGNAASPYARFAAAPRGLDIVDAELTYAEDWRDEDPIQYYRRKSAKCAEVLVPDCVPSSFLVGAYVSCNESLARFDALGVTLQAEVDAHLFFR